MIKLEELIESFRRSEHRYNDDDCWYSCPAHEDYCGESPRVCNCELESHNARVDEALQMVRDRMLD